MDGFLKFVATTHSPPTKMQSDWKLKTTTAWKILGQRHAKRSKEKECKSNLHTNGEVRENISELCKEIEWATLLSAHDVWKVLGLRRNYRSLPAPSPLATEICSVELIDRFAAIGNEVKSQAKPKHKTRTKSQKYMSSNSRTSHPCTFLKK